MALRYLEGESHRDAYWAGGVSIGLHVGVALWVLTMTASLAPPGQAAQGTGSGTLAMTLLGADEFRQPVIVVQTPPSAIPLEQPAAEPPVPDTEIDVPDSTRQIDAANTAAAMSAASMDAAPPSASVDTSSGGAVSATVQPVETPMPSFVPYSREQEYLFALREAVRSQWPPSTGPCSITIQQMVGGRVVAAVSESCAMGAAARQSLEAAALAAQPLPYAGFERVFRERVTINMGM